MRRVEVERERHVVQRLGEGPGHRGQDDKDVERGSLAPSHLDGDGEQMIVSAQLTKVRTFCPVRFRWC